MVIKMLVQTTIIVTVTFVIFVERVSRPSALL